MINESGNQVQLVVTYFSKSNLATEIIEETLGGLQCDTTSWVGSWIPHTGPEQILFRCKYNTCICGSDNPKLMIMASPELSNLRTFTSHLPASYHAGPPEHLAARTTSRSSLHRPTYTIKLTTQPMFPSPLPPSSSSQNTHHVPQTLTAPYLNSVNSLNKTLHPASATSSAPIHSSQPLLAPRHPGRNS